MRKNEAQNPEGNRRESLILQILRTWITGNSNPDKLIIRIEITHW